MMDWQKNRPDRLDAVRHIHFFKELLSRHFAYTNCAELCNWVAFSVNCFGVWTLMAITGSAAVQN